MENQTENSFMNMTSLSIIGKSSVQSQSVISCNSSVGLNFISSHEITLDSLTFISCGIIADNGISAVLYFGSCENVTMSSTSFINSYRNAIVFENMAGNIIKIHL